MPSIYAYCIPLYTQNNYMGGSRSATINNVAHPKHPEEEETSPNRNRKFDYIKVGCKGVQITRAYLHDAVIL